MIAPIKTTGPLNVLGTQLVPSAWKTVPAGTEMEPVKRTRVIMAGMWCVL